MNFDLDESVSLLRNTPSLLRTLLADRPDEWARSNYGPNTFSPLDVVAHLIHGERSDWIPRVRIILEHGPARPFAPFDHTAAYDESLGRTMSDLLDHFEWLRSDNLETLATLAVRQQLDRSGTHPALGPVTLAQLLAAWTVHDLHHVAQICKAMSYQYKEAIGPWLEFIGIVPR